MKETLIVGPDCIERFFTAEEFPVLSRCQIEMAGQSFLKPPYFIERNLPFHVVVITVRGHGFYRLADRAGSLGRGEVLAVPAHSDYRYEIGGAKHWHIVWFLLRPSKQWGAIDREAGCEAVSNPDHLDNVLSLLHSERRGDVRNGEELCEAGCRQLFFMLERTLCQAAPRSPAEGRLRALYSAIEDNPAHPWTTSEIARLCHVSTSHLHKLARSCFGTNPVVELRRIRLQRARVLLRTTNLPIGQIAERVGYTDAKAFSTAYRRVMGQTPSATRAASRAGPSAGSHDKPCRTKGTC